VSEEGLFLVKVGDEEGGDLLFYLGEVGIVFMLFSVPVAFYYVSEVEESLKTDLYVLWLWSEYVSIVIILEY
jgi:hypothetical protein